MTAVLKPWTEVVEDVLAVILISWPLDLRNACRRRETNDLYSGRVSDCLGARGLKLATASG